MTLYLQLFYEFFKTGLFAVGGGLATLPFLYNIADRYPDWFTRVDVANMIAISEATPGPLGVNMSTYAGFRVDGVLGAVFTTLSLVAPSVIVIIIVAKSLQRFNESKLVKSAFYGLRPAVAGLIASAAIEALKVSIINADKIFNTLNVSEWFDVKSLILAAVLFILTRFKKIKKIHPVFFIICGAVIGVIFKF